MFGSGRKIAMPTATSARQRMAAQAKRRRIVSASIAAGRGFTLRGSFAPPPAREMQLTVATGSWGFAWRRDCREKKRVPADMNPIRLLLTPLLLGSLVIICAARTDSVERDVDFKTANGTVLKGTYF